MRTALLDQAAKDELSNARTFNPEIGTLELLPFGLGDAYELVREGGATLIPGKAELEAVEGLTGTKPNGVSVLRLDFD